MTDELAARRARIRRLAQKRPLEVRVTVTISPRQGALERLAEVLVDLLDVTPGSGTS